MSRVRIGAAGWQTVRAIERTERDPGRALKSYGELFTCVEVSSTFFRVPSMSTFASWASLTPGDFRFALRVPEAVSHLDLEIPERISRLQTFLARLRPLDEKCGLLILTLPVDAVFGQTSIELLARVQDHCGNRLVCQARHQSWSSTEADQQLKARGIPLASIIGGASIASRAPVGDGTRQYWRVHHAPGQDHGEKIYHELAAHFGGSDEVWIVCDHCRQAEHLVSISLATPASPQASNSPAKLGQTQRKVQPHTLPLTCPDQQIQQTFHLYFLKNDHSVSHILAVEFASCEQVFQWIGGHKYAHDIEVWRDSELIAVCPSVLCLSRRAKGSGTGAPLIEGAAL